MGNAAVLVSPVHRWNDRKVYWKFTEVLLRYRNSQVPVRIPSSRVTSERIKESIACCQGVLPLSNPFDTIDALYRELDGASDRAAAVVSGAVLDGLLEELLRQLFLDDPTNDKRIFDGSGPLATFSAKIDIAWRLGLISESEHRIIHVVRSIRNNFAHELSSISFRDQSIEARCRNIEMPAAMVAPRTIAMPEATENPSVPVIEKADRGNPRALFQETIFTLIHVLAARIADASRSKRHSPVDFVAAHESGERLLDQVKSKLDQLVTHYKDTASTHRDEIVAEIALYLAVIERAEFCINQIKAAHALDSSKPAPAD